MELAWFATRTVYAPHAAPEYTQRSILNPVVAGLEVAGASQARETLVAVVVARKANTPASVLVPVADT